MRYLLVEYYKTTIYNLCSIRFDLILFLHCIILIWRNNMKKSIMFLTLSLFCLCPKNPNSDNDVVYHIFKKENENYVLNNLLNVH